MTGQIEITEYTEVNREFAKVDTMVDAKRIAYSRGYTLGETIKRDHRDAPAFTFLYDVNGEEVGFIEHPGICEEKYQYFATTN